MKKIIFLAFLLNFINTENIQAEDNIPLNRIPVTIVTTYDGDTVRATLDNKKTTIRLAGIDCPESHTSDKSLAQAEKMNIKPQDVKIYGKQAQQELKRLLAFHEGNIYFEETPEKVCKNEKRKVGILWTGDGLNINEYMIEKAGCVPYSCAEKN